MSAELSDLRSIELDKFSANAATMLLNRDELVRFFKSIGYEVEKSRNGYRGRCPACRQSYCFIGVHGHHHVVFWKCFDTACDSNTHKSKLFHNLLGLVRGNVPGGKLGTAIKVISEFLGFEGRSFDITNGKFESELSLP